MTVASILSQISEQSTGSAIDTILRKLRLKVWKQRSSLQVTNNGRSTKINVRPRSTDAEVVWQCFSAKQYEVPVVVGAPALHRKAVDAKYRSIVSSGLTPLIIDCGANVGASTAWLKMKYPEATIVAVEPAPDNFAALKSNCKQYQDVEPIEAGLGANDTRAFLKDEGGGAWGYQTSTEDSGTSIQMVTLATLMAGKPANKYTPFLLKIDIEGAEKDLFTAETYPDFQQFPVLIFESHDFYMPGKRTSSPFFRFHSETGRDFLFGLENIFSIDLNPSI